LGSSSIVSRGHASSRVPHLAGIRQRNSFSAFCLSIAGTVGYRLPSLDINPQTREEGRCSLAAEALRSWGVVKLRARGVSMLPSLWPGDLLTVQFRRPEQVEPGELVLYMRHRRFFVHRVVSRRLAGNEVVLVARGLVLFACWQTFAVSPDGGLHALPLEPIPPRRAATMGTLQHSSELNDVRSIRAKDLPVCSTCSMWVPVLVVRAWRTLREVCVGPRPLTARSRFIGPVSVPPTCCVNRKPTTMAGSA
jgi:hypothetical protein